MSELKICCVCLTKDVRMYNYKDFHLNLYYEEVLAQQLLKGLPPYFCYICAAMLYKFHKFKEKCKTGLETLKELLYSYGGITLELMSQVDRKEKNLLSNFNTLIENERIKSYSMFYESPDFIKTEEEEYMETNNLETEYDCDSPEFNIKQEENLEENVDDKKDIIDEQEINIDKEEIDLDIEKTGDNNLFDDTHANQDKLLDDTLESEDKLLDDTLESEDKLFNDTHASNLFDDTLESEDKLLDDTLESEDKLLDDTLESEDKLLDDTLESEDKLLDDKLESEDKLFDDTLESEDKLFDDTLESEDKLLDDTFKSEDKLLDDTLESEDKLFDDTHASQNNLFDETNTSEEKKSEPKLNISKTGKLQIKSDDKKKDKKPNKRKNTAKNKTNSINKRTLDPKYWFKKQLTEEEARETFKARSMSSKYLKLKYKCKICYTGFSKEHMLIRHTKTVHDESLGPYECYICGRRFKLKNGIIKHIFIHYKEYKCLRCDIIFHNGGAAYSHNDFHIGVMSQCKYCGMKFRYMTTCYSHIRLCHRSEHLCSLCGASFVSEKGLQKHKNMTHLYIATNTDKKEDGVNTYCVRCDIKFETVKAYDKHFTRSDKHADEQTPGNKINKQMKLPDSSADDTATPEGSKGKRKKIAKRTPTTCFMCNKLFPSYYQYAKHHRSEHRGTPIPAEHKEVCEVCGRAIVAGTIAQHMNVHTRKISFSCDTCGMKFNQLGNLTRHRLTHTGEKPFKCPLCDKRFTQKASMQLHHRTFHLKEPYPKRVRRKKNTKSKEIPLFEDFSEDSED